MLKTRDFYPRPPGGGRLALIETLYEETDFYPRPPGGGRQCAKWILFVAERFLSTPSGWRATVLSVAAGSRIKYFYPRPPGGGRPAVFLQHTAI